MPVNLRLVQRSREMSTRCFSNARMTAYINIQLNRSISTEVLPHGVHCYKFVTFFIRSGSQQGSAGPGVPVWAARQSCALVVAVPKGALVWYASPRRPIGYARALSAL